MLLALALFCAFVAYLVIASALRGITVQQYIQEVMS